jgi:Bacterial Ig-like domain
VSFSQATIEYVNPPIQSGAQLYLSWVSSSPPGTTFQVYVNDALAWYGTSSATTIVCPEALSRIDIGTVGPGEGQTNFAPYLPTAPEAYAEIAWLGGTFESPNLASWSVYGSDAPGGAVDYTTVLATIPASSGGAAVAASGTFSFTAGPLASGVWTFAVVPYDTAGNAGTPATQTVTIEVPPIEPAPFPDDTRLQYTYPGAPGPYEVTLNWNPIPSA